MHTWGQLPYALRFTSKNYFALVTQDLFVLLRGLGLLRHQPCRRGIDVCACVCGSIACVAATCVWQQ